MLPPAQEPLEVVTIIGGTPVLHSLFWVGESFFELIIAVFLAVVVSVYWSIDYYRIERLWLLLLPLQYRIPALTRPSTSRARRFARTGRTPCRHPGFVRAGRDGVSPPVGEHYRTTQPTVT
jgi:hypothetical protein